MAWAQDFAQAVLGLASDHTAASSNWGSLHPDLIATFTQVGFDNKETGLAFKAAVKDGNIEQQFNWSSPFENFTAESRHPTLMAAAQSGALGELTQSLGGLVAEKDSKTVQNLKEFADTAIGKTSITKVNSRQVFAGHAPLKITMTLVLRAWQDPQREVAAPFAVLQQMAYPPRLAQDVIKEGADKWKEEDGSFSKAALAALFPSDAPLFVKLKYKGETYPPLVFESIGKPLDAPYSPMGDLWLEIPVSLESYQSLDWQDIQDARTGIAGKLIDAGVAKASSLFK